MGKGGSSVRGLQLGPVLATIFDNVLLHQKGGRMTTSLTPPLKR